MALGLTGTDLACERGGRLLFRDVSFAVSGGEALLIEGPNGSGKTTLLRAIAGLGRFAHGAVALSGAPEAAETGELAHYIGHADAVKPQLTVQENLAFWAGYLGGGDVEAALDLFALDIIADLPAQVLSAGQHRKLALARLVLVRRPLWLLDEPTVSLDAHTRKAVADLMQAHVAGGGLLLATTHTDLGMKFSGSLKLGGRPA